MRRQFLRRAPGAMRLRQLENLVAHIRLSAYIQTKSTHRMGWGPSATPPTGAMRRRKELGMSGLGAVRRRTSVRLRAALVMGMVGGVSMLSASLAPGAARAEIVCDPTGTVCPARYLFISLLGGDSHSHIAVADSGNAYGETGRPLPLAVPTIAVTGSGHAYGSIAVAATGDAHGGWVAVSLAGNSDGGRYANICPMGTCG